MKFFYTGSGKFEGIQQLPEYSLGGYISGSEIADGLLANLFDQITPLTKKQNKTETRVIAIHNDSTSTLTTLKVWAEYQAESDQLNQAYFKIGFKAPSVDRCGDLYVDSIGNSQAQPRGVVLAECDGEDNAISLPNLSADGYLIIYIQRILEAETLQPLSDEVLEQILDNEITLDTEEEVQLIFSYD